MVNPQPNQNSPATIPGNGQTPRTVDVPVMANRAQAVLEAHKRYSELQKAIDSALPDALVVIKGKRYRTKSYWRTVAMIMGIRVRLDTDEPMTFNGSTGWIVVYEATLGERAATGDGACSVDELTRDNLAPDLHSVRSRANTRGYNRAVSNFVGFGEVSAEEAWSETNEGARY